MLKLINVNKSYFSNQVLHNININIGRGEIIGLLGPNGAGKSTTMKIMTGFLFPDSGEVLINDYDIHSNSDLKSKIGYLPESNPLYDEMGVDEFLIYTAELKRVKNPAEEMKRVIGLVGLKDKKRVFISTLSKGYRQRVGIASALIGDPEILILDEPTEGLDPGQRDEIKKLILGLGKEKTIIISSHVLGEISNMVNRVLIISEGKIKLDEKTNNIGLMKEGRMKLFIHYEGEITIDSIEKKFNDIEISHSKQGELNKIEITTKSDIRGDLFTLLKSKKISILEFYSKKANLEDVFFDNI